MAKLWSVAQGKLVEFDLDLGENNEVVATNGDEMLKFPAGLTKAEYKKLFDQHNKANEGVQALDPEEEKAKEEQTEKARNVLKTL